MCVLHICLFSPDVQFPPKCVLFDLLWNIILFICSLYLPCPGTYCMWCVVLGGQRPHLRPSQFQSGRSPLCSRFFHSWSLKHNGINLLIYIVEQVFSFLCFFITAMSYFFVRIYIWEHYTFLFHFSASPPVSARCCRNLLLPWIS